MRTSARIAGYHNFVARTIKTATETGCCRVVVKNEEVKTMLMRATAKAGLLTLVQADGKIVVAKRR